MLWQKDSILGEYRPGGRHRGMICLWTQMLGSTCKPENHGVHVWGICMRVLSSWHEVRTAVRPTCVQVLMVSSAGEP